MERRLFKQIIIGFFVIFIFSGLGWKIYSFFKLPPSCFDNNKNQGEEGVDCGGPCIPCTLKNNPPISVSEEPIILPNQEKKFDVIFKLSNLSPDWGAKILPYKLTITGMGEEKKEITGTGFILPQESRRFIEPLIELDFNPVKAEIEINKNAIIWEKPLKGINLGLDEPFTLTNVRLIKPQPSPDALHRNVYVFSKTLKLGMKDPEVYNLQKVLSLNPDVYPEGKTTGYFGEATESAVKRFQEKYGIRITGEVGPQTRAKLHELYGPTKTDPFSYTFTLTLKKGMEGVEVLNLQRALMLDATVSPKGSVSGYFDKDTESAVKEFQKKYGIPATGEVGAQTREKLNELYSKPKETTPQLLEDYFESYEGSLEVKGDVYNNTLYNFAKGSIGIVICDEKNKPVTAGLALIEDIYSEKTRSFAIRWRQPLTENVSVCEKISNINILDAENVFLLK